MVHAVGRGMARLLPGHIVILLCPLSPLRMNKNPKPFLRNS
jgi:hypothetical protein